MVLTEQSQSYHVYHFSSPSGKPVIVANCTISTDWPMASKPVLRVQLLQ